MKCCSSQSREVRAQKSHEGERKVSGGLSKGWQESEMEQAPAASQGRSPEPFTSCAAAS